MVDEVKNPIDFNLFILKDIVLILKFMNDLNWSEWVRMTNFQNSRDHIKCFLLFNVFTVYTFKFL
jgi:hypothetical protein